MELEYLSKNAKRLRLTEYIDKVLNQMGRYQKALVIHVCIANVLVGINHTLTTLHTFVPKFHCADDDREYVEGCQTEGMGNATTSCRNYQFDGDVDDNTLVTEWLLICARSYLGPLLNTLYFCGVGVGSVVCGRLIDYYGRMRMTFLCVVSQFILGVLLYFVESYETFTAIRFIQGFFVQGLECATFTLQFELSSEKYRMIGGTWFHITWGFGLIYLGVSSYFFHDWRALQLMASIPSLVFILYIWYVPESPRWLVSTKKYSQALKVITHIGKKNKNPMTFSDVNSGIGDNVADEELDALKENEQPPSQQKKSKFTDVVRNRILRKHLIGMVLLSFSCGLSYYGFLFFMPNMGGDRHINFTISSITETTFYVLAYFIIIKYGLRNPLIFYQLVNGMICIAIGAFSYLSTSGENDSSWRESTIVMLLLMGAKMVSVASYLNMMIMVVELFPTVCRGVAFGICGFASRLACLLSPQLTAQVSVLGAIVPMFIVGICLFTSGSIMFYMPDTRNFKPPHTLLDVERVWGKKRDFTSNNYSLDN